MPWRTGPMEERMEVVVKMSSGLYTIVEISEQHRVSRKTVYKWWDRFQKEGAAGLLDRSRAPLSCPHAIEEEIEERIVTERLVRPNWGARKILAKLRREDGQCQYPADSTGHEVLKRAGLIVEKKRRPKGISLKKGPIESMAPNDVFTADFKGEFRMGNTQYCYPLTITDHRSRYLLSCQALDGTQTQPSREVFERVFQEYGLPKEIWTDHGAPFAGRGLRRLSQLSAWWIRLGIEPFQVRCAQENGRHERMHRTLKQETTRPPAQDLSRQQRLFDHFQQEYNHTRPHEGLNDQVPGDLYRQSCRAMPKRLPEVDYPGHFELRKVDSRGRITWKNTEIFVSEALYRERIGLEEVDDGIWSIYLAQTLIGYLDERKGKAF